MDWANILLQVLNMAVVGSLTFDRANVLRANVQRIMAEQRDPTPAEWAELQAHGIEASARLDAAAGRLQS